MGNKSKSRNAFYYFMLDFKQKSSVQLDMKAVADAANPHWQKMTPEQRKPFEEKAKADKRNRGDIKYTSTGVNIAVMQKQVEEKSAREDRMKEYIENLVHVGVEGGNIEEQPFHFIHMNHYGYCNSTRQFIPAELALARFTLKTGVIPDNVYHSMIYPGKLPVGYAFQAQKVAEESHQIAPILDPDAKSNVREAFEDFLEFLNRFANDNKSKIPPVYVDESNKTCVENLLGTFCLNSGYSEDYVKVYSLEYLLFTLRNAVSNMAQPVYPSVAMTKLELEKDKYDFCKDIPCSYHINSDVPYHCSRSRVIRLAYIVCDNCCSDLEIDLIPGQHIPSGSKVVARLPLSAASSISNISTIKHASTRARNPNYFLSQPTESEMSETSSVCGSEDMVALGAYGYGDDSDLSVGNEDNQPSGLWEQARSKNRRQDRRQNQSQNSAKSANTPFSSFDFSQCSIGGTVPKSSGSLGGGSSQSSRQRAVLRNLNTTSQSHDESSTSSQQTFSRRPTRPSVVFTGGITLPPPGQGFPNKVLPVTIGRGRGLGANANAK